MHGCAASTACGVRWLASKSITWQMQEGKATLHIFEGKEKCKAKAKLRDLIRMKSSMM